MGKKAGSKTITTNDGQSQIIVTETILVLPGSQFQYGKDYMLSYITQDGPQSTALAKDSNKRVTGNIKPRDLSISDSIIQLESAPQTLLVASLPQTHSM